MSEPLFIPGTRVGTAVGAITIFIANIQSADIIKTILLAATGAVVSFFISLLLRKAVKWWNHRQ